VFGPGSIVRLSDELNRLGVRKVCVVADTNCEKIGHLKKVVSNIPKDVTFDILPAVSGEPTTDTMDQAVEFVRKQQPQQVIGIGGGSAMDTAKIAAALARSEGRTEDYFSLPPSAPARQFKPSIKTILIPTTSGTGSEADSGVVVITTVKGRKMKLVTGSPTMYADVSIVDPEMTVTLPPRQTAGCGMDALSHLLEGYLSSETFPVSDMFALKGAQLVFRSLRSAYHDGSDIAARFDMALAASLGGYIFSFPWFAAYLGHAVAEYAGAKFAIPHGIACGIALPYMMEFNLPACTERLALLARTIDIHTTGTTREMATAAVEMVASLIRDVDLPMSFREAGVPESEVKPIAKDLFEIIQHGYNLPATSPRKLTAENAHNYVRNMWEGKILGRET
jgi:alcohol dehydrogenase